jgi:DNA-binding NarL/FixJ family response regulator
MPITLVLADDHPLILDGLESLLKAEQDFTVLARCSTGEESVAAVREHNPDILVLDIRMPGMDGFEVLRELKQAKLPTRVVLLTAALEEHALVEVIGLGVRGVVLKEMAPRLLVRCIRTVHEGGQWLEKRASARALDTLVRREAGLRQASTILTARELAIVRAIANGRRNKEIAEQLKIAEGTVKVHLHNIYQKLGVDSRLALMLYARQNALN